MAQANPVQLRRTLQGMVFPVDKRALLDKARDDGEVEDEVLWSFERLPDQQFRTPSDVIHAVGALSAKDG